MSEFVHKSCLTFELTTQGLWKTIPLPNETQEDIKILEI